MMSYATSTQTTSTSTGITSNPQHINPSNSAQMQRGQTVEMMDTDSDPTLVRINDVADSGIHTTPHTQQPQPISQSSPSLSERAQIIPRLDALRNELKYPNHEDLRKRAEVFDLFSKHDLNSKPDAFWLEIAISVPQEFRNDFLGLDPRIRKSIREYINDFNSTIKAQLIEQDTPEEIPLLRSFIDGVEVGLKTLFLKRPPVTLQQV